jgi:hypothetical protein
MKLNWGNSILIFIIVFLSICTVFIIFSLRQNNDLVSDNYYREGADYSSRLEVVTRSQPYYDSILVLQRTEYIALYPAASILSGSNKFDIWFYRPSGKESDLKAEISIESDSLVISKSALTRGRYLLKIGWLMDDLEFAIEKDLFIDKTKTE